jgi:hypothetical protein
LIIELLESFYAGKIICSINVLLYIIYIDDIENRIKSLDPLTNIGISTISMLYCIQRLDETIFIIQNVKDKLFVDFFVYNRYIKINRANIEIAVAE